MLQLWFKLFPDLFHFLALNINLILLVTKLTFEEIEVLRLGYSEML